MRSLTPRQLEILTLAGNGMRAPQIAEKLFLSPRTVNHTLQDARERLVAKTNAQAVARAVVTEQLILGSDGDLRVPELVPA